MTLKCFDRRGKIKVETKVNVKVKVEEVESHLEISCACSMREFLPPTLQPKLSNSEQETADQLRIV